MGLADQVQDLVDTVESTRQAITAHDVDLPPGSGLHAFPAAIDAIPKVSPPIDDSFPFPYDYPDIMDGYVTGTFRGLVLLDQNDDNNWVSFSVTASDGYRVNWGDGSSEQTFGSDVTCSHNFLWNSGGPILSDGNRVRVVTVTPVSGAITKIDLIKLPDLWIPYAGRNSMWLDLAADIPGLTYFGLGQSRTIIRHGILRRVAKLNTSAVTNATYLFNYCTSLTRLPDILDFSHVTNATYLFNNCTSLTRLPDILDFSQVTNAPYLFSYCTSLTRLPATGLKVSSTVQRTAMGFAALNNFFEGLGTANAGATINITECPGRTSCDTSIATSKGWTVIMS